MRYVIVYLPLFASKVKKLGLTAEDLRRLELLIMADAKGAPVIAGTHGLRKIRFSLESSSSGKSGGVRACYVVLEDVAYVYLVTLFAKNEQENLDRATRNQVAALVARIRAAHD